MAGSRTLKLSILADIDDLKKNLDVGSKEVEGFGGKLEKFSKVAAAAFAAAAAAAAAYAGKLAIEGVKAAIEDEAAQNRLATALENVTGATDKQIASVETQIGKMSMAYGVADDQLRPAFQRLATATGDLKTANEGMALALDIAASKNISVETAANALGKAYEGNYGAIAKLGVGMSAADLKALGLEGTMQVLANTFGGAATEKAQTLEGRIQRLKIGFEEAKESIGAALLPAVERLVGYFTDNLIPKLSEAKEKALDPIKKAFADNEETMRDLWKFIKDYLVPIFEKTLVVAIENSGKAIAGIITIVSKVFNALRSVIDNAIDGINAFIKAYNAIPILPDIKTITKPGWVTGTTTGSLGNFSMSTGQGSTQIGGITTPTIPSVTSTSSTPSVSAVKGVMPDFSSFLESAPAGKALGAGFSPAAVRAGEEKGNVIINVNAPSAIDEEGFTRAVVSALNNSNGRGTGGATGLIGIVGQ
jgi:hypothetical protein